jgi:mono/diheme cytochrome c family protein
MVTLRLIAASCLVISLGWIASAGPAVDETQLPPSYMPSGKQMYKQYCAACHGSEAKGQGPLAVVLKVPAPDLTTLAKRHDGKFPYEYVSNVLEFGPGFPSHGSADMPTWGPIFRYHDRQNERIVKQRIKNLCDYLATLQVD